MLRSIRLNVQWFFSDRLLLVICLVVILIASKISFAQEQNLGTFFGPGSRPETPSAQQPLYQPTQLPEQRQFSQSQVQQMGGQVPIQDNPQVNSIRPASTNGDITSEVDFPMDNSYASPALVESIASDSESETVTKADALLKKKIKGGPSAGEEKSPEAEEGKKEFGSGKLDISPIISMGGCLAVVLGVFFVLAWVMKRATPQRGGLLPTEVFEKLGSVPYTSKMQLHLFRLGGKLILASVTPDSMEAVAEITNPDEVIHLVSLCKQNDPKSSSAAFRQVLKQYTGEQGSATFYPNAATTSATLTSQVMQHPAQTQMKQRPIGTVSPAKAYQR